MHLCFYCPVFPYKYQANEARNNDFNYTVDSNWALQEIISKCFWFSDSRKMYFKAALYVVSIHSTDSIRSYRIVFLNIVYMSPLPPPQTPYEPI